MEYTLIKQKRKTMAIYITKEATVLVKAPKFISQKDIDGFINQKMPWIEKHLKKRNDIINQKPKYKPYYNSHILLLGKEIPVLEMKEKGMRLTEDALYLQEKADIKKSEKVFKDLAKEFALDYYSQRLKYYSDKMNLKAYSLRVNNAKSQWGSCDSNSVISISIRLIGAEKELIDYVIVHELAHLVYMDHQQNFWNLVATIIPDHKLKRKALKQYQQKITPETWL